MPRKIDWANFRPTFSFKQVEPGGFANVEGLVPMEVVASMLEGLKARTAKRAAAAKTKRKGAKKKQTV